MASIAFEKYGSAEYNKDIDDYNAAFVRTYGTSAQYSTALISSWNTGYRSGSPYSVDYFAQVAGNTGTLEASYYGFSNIDKAYYQNTNQTVSC